MIKNLNIFRIYFIGLLCLFFTTFETNAETISAAPVETVSAQPIPAPSETITMIELFSSQACIFCPQTDEFFAEWIKQPGIIGLACHVDYFDVPKNKGALSKPLCTERQNWYMEKLTAGPNYTPQIVINGRKDVIGYKLDKVSAAIDEAKNTTIYRLNIQKDGDKYTFAVPPLMPKKNLSSSHLILALYDKPHDIKIAAGGNKGKQVLYRRIINEIHDLGPISPDKTTITLEPKIKNRHGGFVAFFQNPENGFISAAGQLKLQPKL